MVYDIPPVFGADFHRQNGRDPVPTLDATELLTRRIIRKRLAAKVEPLSQTPLSPDLLYDNAVSYFQASRAVLEERLLNAADRVGLDVGSEYFGAIQLEIGIEHTERIKSNLRARNQLLAYLGGQELDPEEAMLIWKALLAEATIEETGLLLLHNPEMEAIEAVKCTDPFNSGIVRVVDDRVEMGLYELGSNMDSNVLLTVHPRQSEAANIRYVTMEHDVPPSIVCLKANEAELTDGKTTIELVRRYSNILIPIDIQLRDTAPKRYVSPNGQRYNNQPIAQSCYWRVKHTSAVSE